VPELKHQRGPDFHVVLRLALEMWLHIPVKEILLKKALLVESIGRE
jgi:hypothetical protein